MIYTISKPVLNQYSTASLSTEMTNQLLLGEEVRILEQTDENTARVESLCSGYGGYVDCAGLSEGTGQTTHFVRVPSTLLFHAPDIKTPNPVVLPILAQLNVVQTQKNFSKTPLGWVISDHLLPQGTAHIVDIPALIALARSYLETPYLWGGNTQAGLDCSGLVHILWRRFGINLPRDSKDQQQAAGWQTVSEPRAGDLVFWSGHVGLMVDEACVLHANAHAMRTSIEPLEAVHSRTDQSHYTIRRMI